MGKSEQRKREFIKIAYYIYPGPVTVLDLTIFQFNAWPPRAEQTGKKYK